MKKEKKEQIKEYWEKHKEYMKEYCENNKERIKEKNKSFITRIVKDK